MHRWLVGVATLSLISGIVPAAAATEPVDPADGSPAAILRNTDDDGAPVDGDGLAPRQHVARLVDGVASPVDTPDRPEMVILEGIETDAHYEVRVEVEGRWSEPIEVHADDGDTPDDSSAEAREASPTASAGPVWIGHGVDRVAISSSATRTHEVVVTALDTRPTVTTAEADGPRSARAVPADRPFINSRSSWATSSMGWQCSSGPSQGSVDAMVVHHTAGTNSYSAADSRSLIRGIWYYHAQTKGWCDIAYNFLVDRFGNVFEGRQGGVSAPIIGGHTFGHNSQTSGVAQLGNFDTTTAPWAMTAATGKLVGWKLGIHGVDPSGRSVLTNKASSPTPAGLAPGASVDVRSVIGHRDLGSTSCPGASTYARLSTIRGDAHLGAHVAVLHRTFLGHRPAHHEFGGWFGYAKSNGREATALSMTRTAEFAGPQIDDLYQRVLGRPADGPGRAGWIRQLQRGAWLRSISIGFYASVENYEQEGGTPERFVDSLYRDILRRSPDPVGHANWSRKIRTGTSLTAVVGGFFDSPESRRDRVKLSYQVVLRRGPDPTGTASWSRYLLTHDDLELFAILTASREYASKNLR